MRTTAAVCCALAAAALLTTTACGGTHHAHTAAGGRAKATVKAAKGSERSKGSARQALLAGAALIAGKKSADISAVDDLYGKTSTTTGSYSWGSTGVRSDFMMAPSATGMQRLSHAKLMEVRQIGGATYYHVDPQPRGPLKGKHWMEIDLAAYFGTQTVNDHAAMTAKSNPAVFLRPLAASTDLRTIGTETVDGTSTTHYRGHVPASAAAKKQGLVEPSLVDVWLADDGTLVRYRTDVSSITETTDYRWLGGTRAIPIPPASDTADMTPEMEAARKKALHPSS